MIESFRHKALRLFFESDDRRRLPADSVERIRVVLSYLQAASAIGDMDRPSFRLHPLKGRLKGFWAVNVNANWRIIFRFVDGNAVDIDLVDYHLGTSNADDEESRTSGGTDQRRYRSFGVERSPSGSRPWGNPAAALPRDPGRKCAIT
jgi:proteic killer suppression protein